MNVKNLAQLEATIQRFVSGFNNDYALVAMNKEKHRIPGEKSKLPDSYELTTYFMIQFNLDTENQSEWDAVFPLIDQYRKEVDLENVLLNLK